MNEDKLGSRSANMPSATEWMPQTMTVRFTAVIGKPPPNRTQTECGKNHHG
jgi:hypothetical protein